MQESEKARTLLAQAVKSLSGAAVSATEEAHRRQWKGAALWELAHTLHALNKTSEAERVDAQRVALWRDRPPGELATLALQQTSLAAVIGYGNTSVPPLALSIRERDLDQASANLAGHGRGFRDLRTLQSHPDSQMLLSKRTSNCRSWIWPFPIGLSGTNEQTAGSINRRVVSEESDGDASCRRASTWLSTSGSLLQVPGLRAESPGD